LKRGLNLMGVNQDAQMIIKGPVVVPISSAKRGGGTCHQGRP
jgi:ABC-type xylose transport system permease subunit